MGVWRGDKSVHEVGQNALNDRKKRPRLGVASTFLTMNLSSLSWLLQAFVQGRRLPRGISNDW